MGKVILHASLSSDGFMAGPDDEMDWVFKFGDPDPMIEEFMSTTSAILLGNSTFDVSMKHGQLP